MYFSNIGLITLKNNTFSENKGSKGGAIYFDSETISSNLFYKKY